MREILNTPKTNYEDNQPIFETEKERLAKTVKSPKEYIVKLVPRSEISAFMEKWHYSKSINGLQSSYCFGLYYKDSIDNEEILIGAMIYGRLGMANVWKKYASHSDEVLELRRLALIDSTVRNSESYFIAQSLKWLKKNSEVKTIISYADGFYKHKGIIYQASNFINIGETSKGRKIVYQNKYYHDKAIRTKYNGKLKPFASRLKKALEVGEAYYIETPPKTIYCYYLKKVKS